MKMKMAMAMFFVSLFSIFFLFSIHSDAPFASTPSGHERMLVAYMDGTVSLINDTETQDVLWSVKIGGPACASYRVSPNLDAYIDCGLDWNLYKHNKRMGTVKRVKTNDILKGERREFLKPGVVVRGSIRTDFMVVDAHTGCTPKRAQGTCVADISNMREKFYFMRRDYQIGVENQKDGSIIWNASVAKFMVESDRSACQMKYVPIHRVHIADSDV